MKYIKPEQEKNNNLIINQNTNEENELYQQALNEIKINKVNLFLKKTKSFFEKRKQNKDKEIIFKKNKERTFFSNEQWFKYYLSNIENKKEDLILFKKLIEYYGSPDIKNDFIESDERYYKYHSDFLFCKEMETVFNLFFDKKSRRKRIGYHYDLFDIYKKEIEDAKKLKSIIDNLKLELLTNREYLKEFFENKIENNEKIEESVLKEYDENVQKSLKEYEELTKKYNELIKIIPNKDVDKVNDKDYLSKIIHAANKGLLILFFGDKLLEETIEILDKDNIQYFFLLSILLSKEEVWTEFNITPALLKEKIFKFNQNSKFNVFFVEIIDLLINKRKKALKEDYVMESLLSDLELDDFMLNIEALNLKHKNDYRCT